jgi:hypothetical protein
MTDKREVAIHVINKGLRDDPAYRKDAIRALDVLETRPVIVVEFKNGYEIEIPFIDLYCQTQFNNHVTFEEMVVTAFAWQDVLSGDLIYRLIQVREPSRPDKEIELNKGILVDMVDHYNQA